MDQRVIAIDGPAGSGKSTAARRLADALGYTHLNTGAMYRAVAFLATEGGIDLEDKGKSHVIANIARKMEFDYRIVDGKQHFIVNGDDHTEELFRATLTAQLKPVVNNLEVREALVQKMRAAVHRFLAQGVKGVVMEGRDIGTVVFPNARLKFYIHADIDARTKRRAKELVAKGEVVDFEGLKKQIQYRDDADKQREVGGLKQATDAIDLDTTHLDLEATLQRLLEEVQKKR
jgi:cytidylate kinase